MHVLAKMTFCLILLNFTLKTLISNVKKLACLISSFEEILRRTKRDFLSVLLYLRDEKNHEGKRKKVR